MIAKTTGRIRRGMLIALAAWTLWPAPAPAKTINVPADYPKIQSAIQAANSGDEIVVAAGVYRESLNFQGKNIIVRSNFDPAQAIQPQKASSAWWYVSNTILTTQNQGAVVTFSGGESAKCVLRGFTIGNGTGGILGSGGKATIEYNIIQNNSNTYGVFGTMSQGGAIYGCGGLIQKNVIRGNHSNYGGALANCNGTIQNNIISHNLTHAGSTKPSLTAAKDTPLGYVMPASGGALYNCGGLIRGNTIVDNYVQGSSGWNDAAGGLSGCKGTIVDNIIYHTTMTAALEYDNCSKPAYCLFRASRSGTGNLAADPLFTNPAISDYRIKPGSPAIDAGKGYADLKDDYDGHQRGLRVLAASRGDGSCTDIGACEALPSPVAVWIPYGGPAAGIKEAQPLTVNWFLNSPAGYSIRLSLRKGGMFVCDLGQYGPTYGLAASTCTLPGSLITGNDYTIIGSSAADGTLFSSTPPFTLIGTRKNGTERGVWESYE